MAFGKCLNCIALLLLLLGLGSCTENSDGCHEQIYPIEELLFDVGNLNSVTFEMHSVDSPIVRVEMAVTTDTFFLYTDNYSPDPCNHYVQCYLITYFNKDRKMNISILQPALTTNGNVEFTYGIGGGEDEMFYRSYLEEGGRVPLLTDLSYAHVRKDSGLMFLRLDTIHTLRRVK